VPDSGNIAVGQPIRFPTGDGGTGHAFFYEPCNSRFAAPPVRRDRRDHAVAGPLTKVIHSLMAKGKEKSARLQLLITFPELAHEEIDLVGNCLGPMSVAAWG
jgi:hypothetical protein